MFRSDGYVRRLRELFDRIPYLFVEIQTVCYDYDRIYRAPAVNL